MMTGFKTHRVFPMEVPETDSVLKAAALGKQSPLLAHDTSWQE